MTPTDEIRSSANTGLSGKVRTRILNQDGSATAWSPWFSNLILTAGMDQLPASGYSGIVTYAKRGTGTTATRLNTVDFGVTLSQSGTTVTSTGAFFLSTDVGNIIKYGSSGSSGTEVVITGYTSSTQVTVGTSLSVSSSNAVVWRVNQTGLVTPVDTTSTTFETDTATFDATGGGTGIPTMTHRRGYQFTAVTDTVTFTELGFGWTSGTSGGCWSRVLVPGSGDTLVSGQIYQVEYSISIQLTDGAGLTSVGDSSHPAGDAFNTAGTYILEALQTSAFTDGVVVSPYGTDYKYMYAVLANWTQRTLTSSSALNLTATRSDSTSRSAYSNGTYYVTFTDVFNLSTANSTWYGVLYGNNNGSSAWTLKFTTPIAKDNSHTLTFTRTLRWSRSLTN